jgi:NAD(P)-dependent dehydrogenase (short-subunit alcohol dehydrogenase family)
MSNKNSAAVVIGSNGGIGNSVLKQLKSSEQYDQVLGYNKDSKLKVDITNEQDLQNLRATIINKNLNIKILFNAVGYLHDNNHFPEKKVENINIDYMKKSFLINSIGSALLIKYIAPLMPDNNHSIFACLSARVGSISDNYLGGWYSYRASKAALNQLIKTASIEYKRKKPKLTFISLHPGTVSTNLSKPFIGNKDTLTSDNAAKKIINVLTSVGPEESGFLLDYNKKKIKF